MNSNFNHKFHDSLILSMSLELFCLKDSKIGNGTSSIFQLLTVNACCVKLMSILKYK